MFTDETYVIAEAGINHNGDFDIAQSLVREAAAAGADAVKFQIWDAPELSADPDFVKRLREWEFDQNQWEELSDIANDVGIDFFASVFDESSVDLLTDLNPEFIKIASGDLTHYPLVEYIASSHVPIIMSTGMGTLDEVATAVQTIRQHHDDIALLHCISSYPVSIENLNLRSMDVLRDAFGVPVGFSDHTSGILAPALAVSRGSNIVEKHFTLDKSMDGPDHELSAEPKEFSEMVNQIRQVRKSLGKREITLQETEEESKSAMRRSLTAREDIDRGESFTLQNVKIARPEHGIDPGHYNVILGREASQSLLVNDPITWNDVQ